MSFEDDMIEYDFSDANYYMDYLMNEAEQLKWFEHWELNDFNYYVEHEFINDVEHKYNASDIDELFYEGNQKIEKEKKWCEKMKKGTIYLLTQSLKNRWLLFLATYFL